MVSKKFKVIKLKQFFGGREVFRIVDTSKRGQAMFSITRDFSSRREANLFIKQMIGKR